MCLICHSRLTELRLSRSNELVLRTSKSRKAEDVPWGSDCKFEKGATFDPGIGIQIAVFVICKFCLSVRGSCHFDFFQNMGWVDWTCRLKDKWAKRVFPVFGVVWFCLVLSRFVTLGSIDLLDQSYLVSIHRRPLVTVELVFGAWP